MLRRVWSHLFNFSINYTVVKVLGFDRVFVTGDVRPPLIYQVPNLLRNEVLTGGRVSLVMLDPDEPPNAQGFVHWSPHVRLPWVNSSTLEVAMAAIPDYYWIDTSEDKYHRRTI